VGFIHNYHMKKLIGRDLFRGILKDWRDCEDFYILLGNYELPQKLI